MLILGYSFYRLFIILITSNEPHFKMNSSAFMSLTGIGLDELIQSAAISRQTNLKISRLKTGKKGNDAVLLTVGWCCCYVRYNACWSSPALVQFQGQNSWPSSFISPAIGQMLTRGELCSLNSWENDVNFPPSGARVFETGIGPSFLFIHLFDLSYSSINNN